MSGAVRWFTSSFSFGHSPAPFRLECSLVCSIADAPAPRVAHVSRCAAPPAAQLASLSFAVAPVLRAVHAARCADLLLKQLAQIVFEFVWKVVRSQGRHPSVASAPFAMKQIEGKRSLESSVQTRSCCPEP